MILEKGFDPTCHDGRGRQRWEASQRNRGEEEQLVTPLHAGRAALLQ